MAHQWKFFRAGGFNQVKIDSGADLANLDQLDQKLWTALACPTTGIEFDKRTAELIDTDKDGRIRAPELIAAAKFATGALKNPDGLLKESDTLLFADIADAGIAASAQQIAKFLGKKDAIGLSVADVSDANKVFANTIFNGDGVIIGESCPDDATKTAFAEITSVTGSVMDRSAKLGLDQARLDGFFAEAKAFSEWHGKAEADAKNVLPLGDATLAAAGAVRAIKSKINDFFGRCRMVAFDPRAATLLNRKEEEYAVITRKDLSINAAEIAEFPLAQVGAGKALPLKGAVNPAHAAALTALHDTAVKPLLGEKSELTEADWAAVQSKIAPFEAWASNKVGASVEKLTLIKSRFDELVAERTNTVSVFKNDPDLEKQFGDTPNDPKKNGSLSIQNQLRAREIWLESNQILLLAQQLQQQINSGKKSVSMNVNAAKAGQIEKLAQSVQKKMKVQ